MAFRITPALRDYMEHKHNRTLLVELVEINNTDVEVVDLHVYLPHRNQREKFLTEKRYRAVDVEGVELLLPPYPIEMAEEVVFDLKKWWIFHSIKYEGMKLI